MNVAKYDEENYTIGDLLHHNVNENLLHIYNTNSIRSYAHIINDSFAVSQHLIVKELILKNTENDELNLRKRLKKNNDFSIKKLQSSVNQILFVKKVLKTFNMDTYLKISNDVIDNFNPNEILNEYKLLFRDRTTKPISLNTNYDKIKFVASKLYSKLNIPLITKDKKEDGKKIKSYQVDLDRICFHNYLMSFSNKHYSKKWSQLNKYLEGIPNDVQLKMTDIMCEIRQ